MEDRKRGARVRLGDHLVRTGDGGWCLPLSKVPWFSLMDVRGNLIEKPDPPVTPWPVMKSQLRPWLRLVESMQRDMPRYFGGYRCVAGPVSLERVRHERRVDELLARIFRPASESRLAA